MGSLASGGARLTAAFLESLRRPPGTRVMEARALLEPEHIGEAFENSLAFEGHPECGTDREGKGESEEGISDGERLAFDFSHVAFESFFQLLPAQGILAVSGRDQLDGASPGLIFDAQLNPKFGKRHAVSSPASFRIELPDEECESGSEVFESHVVDD